jgi:membrane associated rhomboid family serine protease
VQHLFSLGETQGVVVWAHIGGFAAGMGLGRLMAALRQLLEQRRTSKN